MKNPITARKTCVSLTPRLSQRRVERGAELIAGYRKDNPPPDDDFITLVDILADLMHFARAVGLTDPGQNFDSAISSASSKV
jgi:hypothetical protein